MNKILLKNGNVYFDGAFSRLDILIENGIVSSVSPDIDCPDSQVLELDGLSVLPGLVDVHVHFREPGFTHKETIATGSRAAAHGGFTTVFTMPNLNPAPDSPENLQIQLDAIEKDSVINILPYATITKGQKGHGELTDYQSLAGKVAGFSDDGRGVQEESLMQEAMEKVAAAGGILVAHCEVDDLLRGGYIHDGRYAAEHGHRGICSESEWAEVERDILLSEKTGCPYHVCHISTKESVQLIREAKARGVDVTCETGPHYLVLCEDDLQEDGRFKMNPPLRSAEDRDALIEGIKDGTIDFIATDHAPHSAEEKSRGLEKSAMGVVGIETSLQIVYTELVQKGIITFGRMMELMSANARKRFNLPECIKAGCPADLTVVDFEKEYVIDPSDFLSMGKATPFAGRTVRGEVQMTLVNGNIAYRKQ